MFLPKKPSKPEKRRIKDAIVEFLDCTDIEFPGNSLPPEDCHLWANTILGYFVVTSEVGFQTNTLDKIPEGSVGFFSLMLDGHNLAEIWQLRDAIVQFGYISINDAAEEFHAAQMLLLKRFLSFCWAQGYLTDEYLSWSWHPQDLERNGKKALFSAALR